VYCSVFCNGSGMPPRKLLPAWIREGLEKIEQDKQKKINMEQNNQGQNAAEKLNDEHASNKKSRFVRCR